MSDTLIENVAAMEGQLTAQRLILAMLIYSARTGVPFDVVQKEIGRIQQLFDEGTQTLFRDQRIYFELGIRAGIESTLGMADAIAELMCARGH